MLKKLEYLLVFFCSYFLIFLNQGMGTSYQMDFELEKLTISGPQNTIDVFVDKSTDDDHNYIYKLEDLYYYGKYVNICFVLGQYSPFIGFYIINKTDNEIKINWNDFIYISPEGQPQKLIPYVRFPIRSNTHKNDTSSNCTFIPPSSKIDGKKGGFFVWLIPSDNLVWDIGYEYDDDEYEKKDFFFTPFFNLNDTIYPISLNMIPYKSDRYKKIEFFFNSNEPVYHPSHNLFSQFTNNKVKKLTDIFFIHASLETLEENINYEFKFRFSIREVD